MALSLSRKVDYALLFLAALAERDGDSLSLKKFADEKHLSYLFLQQLMAPLKRAGLIDAERGVDGGYRLRKQAHAISLRSIVAALEGDFPIMVCQSKDARCLHAGRCGAQDGFTQLQLDLVDLLDRYHVSDFMRMPGRRTPRRTVIAKVSA